MAASIAEFLFPASQHQAQGEAYKVYVGRIKALYHKQVLVPLRSCLDVPEVCPTCISTPGCKGEGVCTPKCKGEDLHLCMRGGRGLHP